MEIRQLRAFVAIANPAPLPPARSGPREEAALACKSQVEKNWERGCSFGRPHVILMKLGTLRHRVDLYCVSTRRSG